MLVRVLNVAADSLEEAVFDDLVTNAVVEHQRLEYKSQLPGTSPDDRREFARDVAAMANGGGGIIVMGIEDDANDAATRITPVGLGGEVTRLSQICVACSSPAGSRSFILGSSKGYIRSRRVAQGTRGIGRTGYYCSRASRRAC